jgi:hypothetical protein
MAGKKQYRIVENWSRNALEKTVEELLADGWTLVGGVAMTTSLGNERTYAQAMIKELYNEDV